MAKKKDITQTGGLNFSELQHLNRQMQGLESMSDDEKLIMQMPSLKAISDQVYYEPMTIPERRKSSVADTNTPFGESFWDPEGMVSDYQFERIENERANNQSGLAQIGNGLLKMTTTALTTLADGTIGALYGLGKGIYNLADNEQI
jgi:hypothetical protein